MSEPSQCATPAANVVRHVRQNSVNGNPRRRCGGRAGRYTSLGDVGGRTKTGRYGNSGIRCGGTAGGIAGFAGGVGLDSGDFDSISPSYTRCNVEKTATH